MSTVTMNILLEEGAHLCTELAARATAGATAAAEVAEHAQAIGLKAVDEAERLHRDYTEAVAAIKHAAEQAAQAGEAAGHAVESVSAESTKAGAALKDMLVTVEGDAYHFGEERTRLFQALDASAHQAEAGFHDLAAKVDAFVEHIAARIKEAEDALKHVQEAVQQTASRVTESERHLDEQLDELGASGVEAMSYVAHALDQTLAGIAEGIVKFANAGIAGHNHVVAAVLHGYVDATKEDPQPARTYLEDSFDTLREAVAGLALLPEPAQDSLHAATAAILEAGEKAVNGLNETTQSLQHTLQVVTP